MIVNCKLTIHLFNYYLIDRFIYLNWISYFEFLRNLILIPQLIKYLPGLNTVMCLRIKLGLEFRHLKHRKERFREIDMFVPQLTKNSRIIYINFWAIVNKHKNCVVSNQICDKNFWTVTIQSKKEINSCF